MYFCVKIRAWVFIRPRGAGLYVMYDRFAVICFMVVKGSVTTCTNGQRKMVMLCPHLMQSHPWWAAIYLRYLFAIWNTIFRSCFTWSSYNWFKFYTTVLEKHKDLSTNSRSSPLMLIAGVLDNGIGALGSFSPNYWSSTWTVPRGLFTMNPSVDVRAVKYPDAWGL